MGAGKETRSHQSFGTHFLAAFSDEPPLPFIFRDRDIWGGLGGLKGRDNQHRVGTLAPGKPRLEGTLGGHAVHSTRY